MKSDRGHRKWLEEYRALKQVDEKDPFTVPPGYFNELEQKITSAIRLEELKSDKGFTVPKNYFDELAGNIQSRITIDKFETGKGFATPDNYFDELSSNIQSRVSIEGFINNETAGHTVPADYFENLGEQIAARIFIEETLNKQEEFIVPADYFDKLNKAIVNKTITQDAINRRGVVRKMFANSAFKYAAAACFAVVVGTGVLIAELNAPSVTEHNQTFLHKQLSTVSTGDIQTYLQDDVDASETQHAVIDEASPATDADLNNALQSIATNN